MTRRFRPTVNLWTLSADAIATLQVGQWVSAGTPDETRANCGRFYGIRPSGSVVVAWNGNARRCDGGAAAYRRTIRDYGRSR